MSDFRTDIKRRINHNKNAIICIVGETGGGKSYLGLEIASQLDKNFSVDRVCFSSREFMSLINSGNLKKGNVIIWDEMGIGADARQWHSLSNQMISYCFETFRFMNLVLILTVPSFSFIDVRLRKLSHYLIEPYMIDFENKKVACKVLRLEHRPRSKRDDVYEKFLVERGIKIKRTWFNHPPMKLAKEYEAKRKPFMRDFYLRLEAQQKKMDKEDTQKYFDADTVRDYILAHPKEYQKEYNKRTFIDIHKIMSKHNIGRSRAMKLKQEIEENLDI